MHLILPQRILNILLLNTNPLALRMVHQALLVHNILQQIFRRLEIVPRPVEDGLAWFYFLDLLEVFFEEGVLEALLGCDALVWVEAEHPG